MLTANPEASERASPLHQRRCLASLRSQCESVKPGESVAFYVSEVTIVSPPVMRRQVPTFGHLPWTISPSFALGPGEASDRGGRGACFCARTGVTGEAVLSGETDDLGEIWKGCGCLATRAFSLFATQWSVVSPGKRG